MEVGIEKSFVDGLEPVAMVNNICGRGDMERDPATREHGIVVADGFWIV